MQLKVCTGVLTSKMHTNQQATEPKNKSKAKEESLPGGRGHHSDHPAQRANCLLVAQQRTEPITLSHNWIPCQDS